MSTGKKTAIPRLKDIAARVPQSAWELAEAVLPPTERHALHQLRSAVTGGRGRPEADDDELLLQMAKLLRDAPDLAVKRAAEAVVAPLPHEYNKLTSGDNRVQVAKARNLSRDNYQTHLQDKFAKHRDELFRRVDSQEHGRRLAQRWVPAVAGQQGGNPNIRLDRDFAAKLTPAVMQRANSWFSKLSLPDAIDGLLREVRRPTRPRRAD